MTALLPTRVEGTRRQQTKVRAAAHDGRYVEPRAIFDFDPSGNGLQSPLAAPLNAFLSLIPRHFAPTSAACIPAPLSRQGPFSQIHRIGTQRLPAAVYAEVP